MRRYIERFEKQGKTPVIPPKRNRTTQQEYDKRSLNFTRCNSITSSS
ncbi:hypothetical protein [Pseudanabaena yagii]|uniref:Transposase n=1 Tax=Pseudanabaena yagii GIHE-NHR1 TaxID=2722753 RepID=A0ABX1LZ51_9CYAN|nr:hypothetical protein [Pseudanabaena yagii]NMF60044.1 hypothetical protein [Pseudanabaena yagii GIHE-NHR1]